MTEDMSDSIGGSGECARRPVFKASPWLVVTLGSLSGFAPLAIDMYLPAFPRIAAELGSTEGAVQLSLSVFLLGLAAGQMLWGSLSDYRGRRGPLLAGCALFSAASIVCAFSPTIGVLIASRFLMGLSGSAGVVLARAVVRDLFEENESARFYSMMMIIGGLAPIIAPFLGGLILKHFSWRVVFWVVAAFGAVAASAVALHVFETHPAERRCRLPVGTLFGRYARLFANPGFVVYALGAAMGSGLLFAYISESPFVFMDLHGVSPQRFSLFFAANAAGLYGAGQMNRILLRRFAARRMLAYGCVVNAAACVTLAALAATGFGGFALYAAVLFVCVASLALIFPNATAAAMQPFPHEAGTASALLGMLQYCDGRGVERACGEAPRRDGGADGGGGGGVQRGGMRHCARISAGGGRRKRHVEGSGGGGYTGAACEAAGTGSSPF